LIGINITAKYIFHKVDKQDYDDEFGDNTLELSYAGNRVLTGFNLDAITIASDKKIIDPAGENQENKCNEEGIDTLYKISDCLFRSYIGGC